MGYKRIKAAKARCTEIEQNFSHLRPDGSNFKTIYGYSDDELWYKFCSVGENLGSGQPTAQRVVDSWMASTKVTVKIFSIPILKISP